MYTPLLYVHSYLRWVALALVAALLIRSLVGVFASRPWPAKGGILGRAALSALDLQFLVGLVLYIFASPVVRVAFSDFGQAMQDTQTRFWAVEHIVAMTVALVVIHMGWARALKTPPDRRKHLLVLIFLTLGLLVIAYAIPWPGTSAGRPLFRIGPQ